MTQDMFFTAKEQADTLLMKYDKATSLIIADEIISVVAYLDYHDNRLLEPHWEEVYQIINNK
jgi:hypothetical protein